MSALPPGDGDGAPGGSVPPYYAVLQWLDRPDQPTPDLDTDDLTLREVRDCLWLATTLRLPVDPVDFPEPPLPFEDPESEPETAAQDHPDVAEPPDRDVPDVDPPRPPDRRDEWTPGPADMVSSGLAEAGEYAAEGGTAWPTVPALPEARAISLALKPLSRQAPSPRRLELDEEATALRAAQDRLWVPEWRPAPAREFEVALVVDTSSSMDIWRQTVHEFAALLRTQGAFRDVRFHYLDTSRPEVEDIALRTEGPERKAQHWSRLVDPTGKRIVLVLSDTVGQAWRSDAVGHVLHHWGQRMHVAVVHVLGQRLWTWGGLTARRLRLSAPKPASANRDLRVATSAGAYPDQEGATPGIPVPVLALSADWMAGWARLLTAPGDEWIETTAAIVRPRKDAVRTEPGGPPLPTTAAGLVRRFRTIASVPAFQLAGLLAAAPLNLPLITLVQRVLLPGANLSVLAEVMLGALLRRTAASDARDVVTYDFVDGVREELLATGNRADTVRVARVLDEHAGADMPVLRNFGAAVDAPNETADPEPTDENTPFLKVQAAVFRALSGPYLPRAKRLGRVLIRVPGAGDSVSIQIVEQEKALTQTDPRPSSDATEVQSHPEGVDDVTASGIPLSADMRREVMSQPQIWGLIPLRNPDFVGREELLEQLRIRLTQQGPTAVLPEALHGMGGVGKSQTVVEYIYQHASEYQVVWWISAEHQSQIKTSFVELAKKLGIQGTSSADTAVPAVLEALRLGTPYSRWILVFDNADRPNDVRPFFPAGNGHIIVTSRNAEWGGFARAVEVDLFTRAESVELLHRRGGALEDADADRLAEALGDLPLAIEQAAAWRAQTGMEVAEYLELLDQNRTELLETGTASGYQLPVAAAWNVPLNRLKNEHRAALQLLQVCAFFGPEPISRRLFSGVREAPVPEALSEALSDPIKLNRAIREISRYSLAKLDHRNGTLQLHRLVQTVLKNRLNEDEWRNMRHAVHILLVKGDPGDPGASANWPRYAELLPHATMSQAVECGEKWVRVLIQNLVSYLLSSGDYGGARDLALDAMTAWRVSLGEQDLDTLEMTRLYATALRRLGTIKEAIELNEKTYAAIKLAVGEDHEGVLKIMDTVAADRRSQGLFAEELELQQVVYDRARQILGEDDPTTLEYGQTLAGCYRLMGRFVEARDLDADTLRRRTIILGTDHRLTFGSLNGLSMDLRECGQYIEAAVMQTDALNRQIEIFGEDHPGTIGASRNLAVALRKAGDHVEAKKRAEDCLDRYRRRHGPRHLDTVTAEMTLSADLRHSEDLDESLRLAARSYRLFQEIRSEHHPYTLIAASNLAVTHRLRGELEEARALNAMSAEALRQTFDSDHPFTLVSVTNLASDLAALGDYQAARELDEDTVERSTRVLGATHPSTLAVVLNLALDLAGLGDETAAAVMHSKAVAGLQKVLGDNHPATIAAGQYVRANCDTDTMQL